MNKSYVSKWSSALGAWVACSEITKRAGKQTAIGAVLIGAAAGAFAQNCPQAVDGSYIPGNTNPSCTVVPATTGQYIQPNNAGFYILTRSNLQSVLTIGDTNVQAHVSGGYGGIGNQYAVGPNASMQAGNLTFDITATQNTTTIASHDGVNITAADADITATINFNNPFDSAAIYGVLAGSSVNSGEGGTTNTSRNGTFTTIILDNLELNQTSLGTGKTPTLNAGLRAIQGANQDAGNGSSGKIEIKDTLTMNMTGARIEGIYVSGAATDTNGTEAVSQVVLNDSTITMTQSGTIADSSAIKIGKSRAVGTGKGLLTSNGALSIDMAAAFGGAEDYMSPAIKMAVSGSQLLANGPNSSATISASRSALAIGIDDWGSNVDSGVAPATGIEAQLGNATITTQSTTAPLLLVDSGQQNVQLLFDNGSDLTAATNGYLIDIIRYRSSTAASSVQLSLDNGSVAKGLSNKAYPTSTLAIELNNASTWNLVEKTNGDKTSSYTSFDLLAGSTLNAFTTGAAAFVMNGPVASNASALNLVDNQTDDVLTITPSYSGSNGAELAIDTCLAGSGAESDRLVVTGDTSGATLLKVTPFSDPACSGADTTTTGDGNGILVVEVTGNSDAVFTLDGGTITQGQYDYRLVQVDKNWYLQSQDNRGAVTVTKQVNAPAGAPAFSGTIPFTLNCTSPDFSESGNIDVVSNQGSAAPISVAAGSVCSVTEGSIPSAPTGYHWGTPALPLTSAPMPASGTQTLTITNTLIQDGATTGLLQINKLVQVPSGVPSYSGSIDYSLSCTNPVFNTSGSITITNNQGSVPPIPLVAGSQCTVTVFLPTAPSGLEWTSPVYIQPDVISAGQTTFATITSQLNNRAATSVTPVPVNGSLALGALAALIGLTPLLRRRQSRSKP